MCTNPEKEMRLHCHTDFLGALLHLGAEHSGTDSVRTQSWWVQDVGVQKECATI